MMKLLFFKILFSLLPIIIAAVVLITIDPFNVFHYRNVRDNGIEPNQNYIKMRYILDNPDKFDSYLFGSSMVGGINVATIPGLHCYNMTYSMGIPREHLENLEVMIERKIIPNTVLVGVDEIACFLIPKAHETELLRMPYPRKAVHNSLVYYGFLINYLNPSVLKSVPRILSYKGNNQLFRMKFYENGSLLNATPYFNEKAAEKFDWKNSVGISLPFLYGIDNAIRDIQSIITLCNKHKIKLILFTNPLYHTTYEKAVENGYIDFISRLSEITEFYNFSGTNDITINNDNYLETRHYRFKVGDLIIKTIFNNQTDQEILSQGFGYYVTGENRIEFIDLLRSKSFYPQGRRFYVFK